MAGWRWIFGAARVGSICAGWLSCVGELGWELYTGVEFGAHVHDRLVTAGDGDGREACALGFLARPLESPPREGSIRAAASS